MQQKTQPDPDGVHASAIVRVEAGELHRFYSVLADGGILVSADKPVVGDIAVSPYLGGSFTMTKDAFDLAYEECNQVVESAVTYSPWLVCKMRITHWKRTLSADGSSALTDRELIELAAKAEGIAVVWCSAEGIAVREQDRLEGPCWGRSLYDPIGDDGDALRLAVKRRLKIVLFPDSVKVYLRWTAVTSPISEPYGSDSGAAVRRAITRAAVESLKHAEACT